MERGKLQKINNKKSKEGLESYDKYGNKCILIEYISCIEVIVKFEDGTIKKTKFDRFKNHSFSKVSIGTKEFKDLVSIKTHEAHVKKYNLDTSKSNIKKSLRHKITDEERKNNMRKIRSNSPISKYELLVKDRLEELSFTNQFSLSTKDFRDKLNYSNVPNVYLYDFGSSKYKILIELDGHSHTLYTQKKIDANKEKLAELYNYKVYRYNNDYIKNNLSQFYKDIEDIIKGVVV